MAQNTLALYNIALQALGERSLDSTTEQRATRRELDKAYAQGTNITTYALEQGLWNFAATRAIIAPSTSTPSFQYTNSFAQPSDFVRLIMIASSSGMTDSLFDYKVEGSNIQSNSTALYITYVSNSTSFGGNLALWPETFFQWVGLHLATLVHPTIAEPRVALDVVQARADRTLVNARLKNASEMQRPHPERTPGTIDPRELDYALEIGAVTPRQ